MLYIHSNDLRKDMDSVTIQKRIGRTVKRFFPNKNNSFIFKKIEGNQIQKEVWVMNNILPLTTIHYPKIIEYKENCVVFEDLGDVKHPYEHKHLNEIIKTLNSLHKLPIDLISETFHPRFHSIPDMITFFKQNHKNFSNVFRNLNDVNTFLQVSHLIVNDAHNIQPLQVVSHGDFHIENICIDNEKIYILDWELFCVTDCYSDLFNLLDMTNPYFIWELTNHKRKEILKSYYENSEINHVSFEQFYLDYLLYALLYSFQFIHYRENDRISNNYSEELLDKQLLNIYSNIKNCLIAFNEYKKTPLRIK